MEKIDISRYPLEWESTYNVYGEKSIPYSDSFYKTDKDIINTSVEIDGNKQYPLRHSIGSVWLASRTIISTDMISIFDIRYLNENGSDGGAGLFGSYSDGNSNDGPFSFGVRPIISLKSGLKITGGEGTLTNPYTISN